MTGFGWGDLDAWRWGGVVLALVAGFVWLTAWRRGRLRALAARGPLPTLLDTAGEGRHLLRAGLIVLTAIGLVLALMRPQHGTRATELKNLGIDIAIALDASKSMKVRDVVPDRLTSARLEIDRLLDGLSGGQVALVPFAGLAFVQTPPTSDFEVVKTYLDELRVEDMPRGGTAIGRAITEAVRVLVPSVEIEGEAGGDAPAALTGGDGAKDTAVAPFAGARHKAIILFTDGEDHEGDPLAAAKLAADHDVRIFTVGVGTAQGRPVPIINDDGQVVGTMRGPDGRTPLFSELNSDLLRQIAEITGGAHFDLGPTGLGDGLARAIDALEKQEYEATFRHLRDDRFQLALVPALVLLILEAVIGTARRRRRVRPAREGAK